MHLKKKDEKINLRCITCNNFFLKRIFMSDSKVFMFPEQDRTSDFALLAALQNNQMNNPMAMMGMMNGGMGGMWNNP